MRIRIDRDNQAKVNAARKRNGSEGRPLSAHQEVNKALAAHYAVRVSVAELSSWMQGDTVVKKREMKL